VQIILVRGALFLVASAIAVFSFAFIFNLLALNIFAGLLTKIGGLTLLCAFFVLSIMGLTLAVKQIMQSVIGYFSQHRRLERKFLFELNRWDVLNRKLYFEKSRIAFDNRQKRKRISASSSQMSASKLHNRVKQ
jgi:hypothetical protein